MAWNVSGLSHRPGDHRLATGLDALGNGDLALARQQLDAAHLAQIHAHGVVGAVGRLFLLGGGECLLAGLDEFGGNLLDLLLRLFLFHHVDAHFRQHRHRVLDLVRRNLVGRHDGVQLVDGDVAALLGGLDHLLDGILVQVEKGLVACPLRRIDGQRFLRGWLRGGLRGHTVTFSSVSRIGPWARPRSATGLPSFGARTWVDGANQHISFPPLYRRVDLRFD